MIHAQNILVNEQLHLYSTLANICTWQPPTSKEHRYVNVRHLYLPLYQTVALHNQLQKSESTRITGRDSPGVR
ncbi:hypothetical protein AQUCO_02000290v1 [Aquilegia coerulea]|uniref:Uncharacterized protein n=1 Tax=Aquilegia coerulea TaxID=218851 RepID=A0A2G5DHM3_AQUCA|nr:hypothetical protein AQUCO_02000290v1 [Aquilegia coerulea]